MLSRARLPPAAAIATLAACLAMTTPAAADYPPTVVVLGYDHDPAVREFRADFDSALDHAEVEFDGTIDAGEIAARFQLAHAGQLSPKDQCHKHKAAGERHWHIGEGIERGGPCVKSGGETFHFGKNALCKAQRLELAKAERRYGADYRAIARALKECIQGLPAPTTASGR